MPGNTFGPAAGNWKLCTDRGSRPNSFEPKFVGRPPVPPPRRLCRSFGPRLPGHIVRQHLLPALPKPFKYEYGDAEKTVLFWFCLFVFLRKLSGMVIELLRKDLPSNKLTLKKMHSRMKSRFKKEDATHLIFDHHVI